MAEFNIKRVKELVERGRNVLREARLEPWREFSLLEKNAEERIERETADVSSKLDARARALDALASIAADLAAREVETKLVALREEKHSAMDYMKEAKLLLDAFHGDKSTPTEFIPSTFASLEEARQVKIRVPLLDADTANHLAQQVEAAEEVARDIDHRIDMILSTENVSISDEHLAALKVFKLSP